MDNNTQNKPPLWRRAVEEIKQVWMMTAYFALGFSVLLLMQNMLLAHQGAEQIGYMGALILALLLGKVVIVTEKLSFTNRFRHRRRIGHIVYRSIVFTMVSLLVGAIEKVIKKMFHEESFQSAISQVLGETSLSKTSAVALALLLLFGFLFFVREVNSILGKGVLWRELFTLPKP